MVAYYNEFDPFAAEWLKNLIRGGYIAPGDVDTRSITEVQPDDLKEYTQCHFFAGIGGWSIALRLAGWPDDKIVWTGSPPCQPFSVAGRKRGKEDARHLWPEWSRLIEELHPTILFGEQVEAAITAGWWDDATDDLESKGYAVASAVLPAYSVGAHHRRDRLFFVADASIENDGRTIQESCNLQKSESRSDIFHGDASIGPGGRAGWQVPEPRISLLVDGYSGLMDEYVAIGNAIVPQVAAEFIKAARECIG